MGNHMKALIELPKRNKQNLKDKKLIDFDNFFIILTRNFVLIQFIKILKFIQF